MREQQMLLAVVEVVVVVVLGVGMQQQQQQQRVVSPSSSGQTSGWTTQCLGKSIQHASLTITKNDDFSQGVCQDHARVLLESRYRNVTSAAVRHLLTACN
jgi:hypothetical protein